MADRPFPAVVVFVADVPRVASFYREVGAMATVHADHDHVVLEVAGFQLVVHALRGATAPDEPVVPREDSYLKVCLPVASISSARALAAAHGGAIRPASAEWEAREFRACDGQDPEGNIVQVREPR